MIKKGGENQKPTGIRPLPPPAPPPIPPKVIVVRIEANK